MERDNVLVEMEIGTVAVMMGSEIVTVIVSGIEMVMIVIVNVVIGMVGRRNDVPLLHYDEDQNGDGCCFLDMIVEVR